MKLFVLAALVATANAVTVCSITYSEPDCKGTGTKTCASGSGSCSGLSSGCTNLFGTSIQVTCTSGCFPADSTVALESGESKRMSEVTVGDRVQVGDNQFSDVFMFSHSIPKSKAEYVKITTASKAVLRLTDEHYLYVNGALAPAGKVAVGDKVVLANGTASVVVAVSTVEAEGIYNPHTMHGNIVVDGVTTSTYTTAVHPTVAHAILAPLRALYAAGINVYSAAVESAMPLLNRLLPAGL